MPPAYADATPRYRVRRFAENPLITPSLTGVADDNINGPSVIRNPKWSGNGLGRYLMYFAHHEGKHIRLAHADNVCGPWRLHTAGVLPCESLPWRADHVASPDVHVDEAAREIRLYFHTPTAPMLLSTDPDYAAKALDVPQKTFAATSRDGLHFTVREAELGPSYFRVWQWGGAWYALPRLGTPLLRSADGFAPFTIVPNPLDAHADFVNIRHTAVLVEGDHLTLFYTRIGDAPERILTTRIRMDADPARWSASPPVELLRPEAGYEGAGLPIAPSRFGVSPQAEHALRDPCIFEDAGRLYMFYCVLGEGGIAACELEVTP